MEHDRKELKFLQSLPLERKIEMTAERIDEWYNHYNGNVAISFSGGKDSTVLMDIARNHWRGHPNIKAVYVDTGLEYPEIRQFVKTFDDVDIIRPKMGFADVIKKYGYPIVTKEIASKIQAARKSEDNDYRKWFNNEKLRSDGELSRYNCPKYKPLLDVDFRISADCCRVMKKQPITSYVHKNKLFSITAEMACESAMRLNSWLKYGCNMFDSASPKSKPMSFWTEQDVLEYIYVNKLPIAEPYGEVVYEYGNTKRQEQAGRGAFSVLSERPVNTASQDFSA